RESGTAIVGATIVILGWSLEAGSDSAGRFTYEGLRPGSYMLQARAVGYTVTNWVVKVGEAEEQHRTFPMAPLAVELAPVTVEGQPSYAEHRRLEFEQRRASGRGYFITEGEIRHANATTIGQVLRTVPWVRAICNASGCTMRMARTARGSSRRGRGRRPWWWSADTGRSETHSRPSLHTTRIAARVAACRQAGGRTSTSRTPARGTAA